MIIIEYYKKLGHPDDASKTLRWLNASVQIEIQADPF